VQGKQNWNLTSIRTRSSNNSPLIKGSGWDANTRRYLRVLTLHSSTIPNNFFLKSVIPSAPNLKYGHRKKRRNAFKLSVIKCHGVEFWITSELTNAHQDFSQQLSESEPLKDQTIHNRHGILGKPSFYPPMQHMHWIAGNSRLRPAENLGFIPNTKFALDKAVKQRFTGLCWRHS